jgi:hypothetical protein
MRYDHFSMLPERAFQPRGRYGMTLEGGSSGGGGGSPQPSQVSQVTIPEYAKPYVERLLGKAEAASAEPYQTYAGERLSTTDPEVIKAREGVAALAEPGQFATGTNLASTAGLSAAGAGADYAKMATSAAEQAKYMSPYMQNVVDVQKQEAIRDAQKGQLMQNLGAARQGTYGGARQLLAGTERERNLGDQLAQIQASGSQRAYEDAIRSMQFGTTAGLQGAQTASQAGAVLGQLGIGQQQQNLERLRAQEAAGASTQQEQQAKLDLAYQDFLRQQQYPYAQLGFMSDILRGSGNLAQTGSRALYEAPPSTGSQLLGLASTLGGAYLAGGRRFAEGGEIKGLSGIKGYDDGGDVIADMVDVGKLTPEQIKDTRQSGARSDVPDYVLAGQLDAKIAEMKRLQADMETSDTTAVEDIRQEATQLAGLDSISIPDDYYRSEEETAQLAGGGIIAFADGGSTNERIGGVRYPDGSVGYVLPGVVAAGKAALGYLGRDIGVKALTGTAAGAGRAGLGLGKIAARNPITTAGTLGGLGYGAYDYVTSEGEPGSSEAAAFADKQDKEAGAALAQEAKNKKVEVSDKTVKKIAKAEDAYEKALREELDKTNMSEDDKLQAIGFGMIKAGEKISEGKKGRGIEAFTKGVAAGADEYVKTLNQSKKDKRELTKTLAEYGLAKEKLGIMREEVAAKREGTAETAATRKEIAMQNILAKANAEYNDLVSKNPLMGQRFLDKENKKINPQFKSRADYIREQMAINPSNLMAGVPASSIATPQARAADFYNPRG